MKTREEAIVGDAPSIFRFKGEEIIKKLVSIKRLNTKELDELTTWCFERVADMQEHISKYITDNQYKSDPDVFQERLFNYQHFMGGMSGLVQSLYDRLYAIAYRKCADITDKDGAKLRLTATDKEVYARDEVSDIRGLKTTIDEINDLLRGKSFHVRNSYKKW